MSKPRHQSMNPKCRMDESAFETFEEELGATEQDAPQPKHPRQSQSRRPEIYPQRRAREEPLAVQQIPKSPPYEAPVSRGELLRGRKDGMSLEPIGSVLNARHTAVRKYYLPTPEHETSLWDTFFLWMSDDDDDDEKRSRRGKPRKATREKVTQGLRHKAIPDRKLLKGREGRFKARRGKARQDEKKESRESAKAQKEKAKRLEEKKLEEEKREGKEEKTIKNKLKESRKKAP
ncbi:uncharacterized protein LOC132871243 isoform X3 [Neoarius graeffei]|uniref:uncharacterized protein LOC132871243 isoform X3 n=1 Tax=Neoarius graeffei TaxID=443677 RepID=UPI00298C7A2B|nr:uncharacterized protein LOC132871243 isoform X3 [Neoarius graeffei]